MYNLSLHGDVVIFLDFDGPLLPARMHYEEFNSTIMFDPEASWQDSHAKKKKIRFDPVIISVLNGWIEQTNAKVVISSNWSKYATLQEISEYLSGNGFKHVLAIHDSWKTTKLKSWSRADEIANWLFNHAGTFSNYLILDDDNSVLNDERIRKDKVLLIDFYNGLQWGQIFEGCEILGITEYEKIIS